MEGIPCFLKQLNELQDLQKSKQSEYEKLQKEYKLKKEIVNHLHDVELLGTTVALTRIEAINALSRRDILDMSIQLEEYSERIHQADMERTKMITTLAKSKTTELVLQEKFERLDKKRSQVAREANQWMNDIAEKQVKYLQLQVEQAGKERGGLSQDNMTPQILENRLLLCKKKWRSCIQQQSDELTAILTRNTLLRKELSTML